ncbi:MAG: type II secretion system major pseudopilin GspG [Gammaproteobacteria bacterium]
MKLKNSMLSNGLGRQGANPRGFTLLELLVVLAILGLIATFAAPRVFKYLASARIDSARVQIENLGQALDLYKLEVGTYPPDLEALVQPPAGEARWNGPYLKKSVIPKDPWGNDYVYRFPGEHGPYDLISLGADNAEGGEGENADIVSWE